MKIRTRELALTAATGAALIYGITFTVAKDVMPNYIKPSGFIVVRMIGATLLFWISAAWFAPKEKIDFQFKKKLMFCAIFGVSMNMLTFFEGLNHTSPINASVLMITAPILVLIMSAFILKEKVPFLKIIGIFIGLIGAATLILYGKETEFGGKNMVWGNFLVFVNAAFYSYYIILAKPLLGRFHPLNFMKWLFVFGLIIVLPFGLKEFLEIKFSTFPQIIIWETLFVVVFTSFGTYLLNIYALSNLKPTTMSIFIFLQPFIASFFAILLGKDSLDVVKVFASVLIFIGLFLVTKYKVSNQISK